jgi:hypothetical protein
MADAPKVQDLIQKKQVTEDDVQAAVQAYLAGEPVVMLGAYKVDLAAAIEAHEASKRAVADETTTEGFRKTMVRTALVLAPATKG